MYVGRSCSFYLVTSLSTTCFVLRFRLTPHLATIRMQQNAMKWHATAEPVRELDFDLRLCQAKIALSFWSRRTARPTMHQGAHQENDMGCAASKPPPTSSQDDRGEAEPRQQVRLPRVTAAASSRNGQRRSMQAAADLSGHFSGRRVGPPASCLLPR